jgi:hypothetical protein
MRAKRGYVSRVRRRDNEGELGATWNRSNDGNHCVSVYSYRNNVVLWPTVTKRCKSIESHMPMEHHNWLYIHFSKYWNWSALLLTHVTTAPYRVNTWQCSWSNFCARDKDVVLECRNGSLPVVLHHTFQLIPLVKSPVVRGLGSMMAIPQVRLEQSIVQTKADLITGAYYGWSATVFHPAGSKIEGVTRELLHQSTITT